MVSNSLTLESLKVRSLRLELESLTVFGHFSLFMAKISFSYVLLSSKHFFQASFKEFHMFSSKNCLEFR